MINISYFPKQDLSFINLNLDQMYPDYKQIGTNPIERIYYGSLLAAVTPDIRPVQTAVLETNLKGWLIQDRESWGPLRDKGVQHLSAYGDLQIEGTGPAPVSINPPLYSPSIYFAKKYIAGPNTLYAREIVPWGRDFTIIDTVPSYSYYSTYWRHTSPFTLTQSVKFRGDVAVAEFIEAPYQNIRDSNGQVLSTSYGRARCKFFWLKPQESQKVRSSPRYTVSFGGIYPLDSKYTLPNGARVSPGEVVPDPTLYGISPDTAVNTVYTGWTPPSEGGASGTAEQLIEVLESDELTSWVWNKFVQTPHMFDMGELAKDIIRSKKHVDANLLLTVFDLLTLKRDLSSLVSSGKIIADELRRIPSHVKSVSDFMRHLNRFGKEGSNEFLGILYGVLPTYRDGQALALGIQEIANLGERVDRLHARRTSSETTPQGWSIESTHVLTVDSATLPDDALGNVMGMIRSIKEMGLYPSFDMLWDRVPWSFVFNWFTQYVNELNEYGDYVIDREYYPIHSCTASTKRIFSPPLSSWVPFQGVTGTVMFTHYDRYCQRELPVPSDQTGDGESPQFSHWGEAAALILQRMH